MKMSYEDICREWLKGCTCSAKESPEECKDCTDAFLRAVKRKAKSNGDPIGENSIEGLVYED